MDIHINQHHRPLTGSSSQIRDEGESEVTQKNQLPDELDETHEEIDEEYLQARIRVFRKRQRVMLGFSIFVILAAFSMSTLDTGKVEVSWFPQLPIPELCGSRAIFGVSCPGCGLTRSFIALADGNLAASFQQNRIGWIMALTLIAQIPYRIYMMCQPPLSVMDLRWPKWFGTLLIAILIGNWLSKALI
ncbi:hypothetical protein Enr17x_18110 [Gimesia fumaroli]|jgi:hypothetical protein|uniref:DUF2752 domain-containing protein n=1 Tax=Gimesia fumaroli TaxID=2527976 RepID=A0A518I9L8_9PLAN|nr:hypothetical protein Enr17x_18110 [Gimesia fumaroli]